MGASFNHGTNPIENDPCLDIAPIQMLISPREIQSDESRIPQCSISSYGRAIAEIPHQKPADQKTAGKVQLCLSFHFRTSA